MQQQTDMLARLQTYLAEQTGAAVTITDAKPLAGGASRDTWYFQATIDGENKQLVMRRDLPTQMYDDALTRPQEFTLMAAAHDSGIKVSRVRYLCDDPAVLGSPFFIMDYVAGTSIGPRVIHKPELATAREKLPAQMARQLAAIHALDYARPSLAFLQRPPENITPSLHTVEQTAAILDKLGVRHPVWAWCLRWARRHAPAPDRLTFIHGDFRIGNLLVHESDGLRAVIDWEFAHIGDPDEELGYVCMRDWRFGKGQHHFAGLSDRASFLHMYETASGRKVRRQAVDWWEIMGNIRWGVICLAQANRHLSGEERSVELASLGRRSAEMQLEALRLIDAYNNK